MGDLSGQGYKIAKVYTYGAPRVGDSVFASAFGKRLGSVPFFRVTKSDDPVPLLPPKYPFEHVGQEVYYYGFAGTSFKLCSESEDQSCSDGNHDSSLWLT